MNDDFAKGEAKEEKEGGNRCDKQIRRKHERKKEVREEGKEQAGLLVC